MSRNDSTLQSAFVHDVGALFHRNRMDGRYIATSASDSCILVLTDNAHHLLHLSSSSSAFSLCFALPRFCRRFVRFVFPCLLAATVNVRRVVELEWFCVAWNAVVGVLCLLLNLIRSFHFLAVS